MGKEGRARLVGDSCVPKLHSNLRCHVSFHTRVHVCAHASARTHAYIHVCDTQARTHRHVELDQERLLGGGASGSTPRKYSGQYISPSAPSRLSPSSLQPFLLHLFLCLSCSALLRPASLLPFVPSFFFRVVTSAKLRREPSQFRVVARRVNSGTLLSGKIWSARARRERLPGRPRTLLRKISRHRVASSQVARIL